MGFKNSLGGLLKKGLDWAVKHPDQVIKAVKKVKGKG